MRARFAPQVAKHLIRTSGGATPVLEAHKGCLRPSQECQLPRMCAIAMTIQVLDELHDDALLDTLHDDAQGSCPSWPHGLTRARPYMSKHTLNAMGAWQQSVAGPPCHPWAPSCPHCSAVETRGAGTAIVGWQSPATCQPRRTLAPGAGAPALHPLVRSRTAPTGWAAHQPSETRSRTASEAG